MRVYLSAGAVGVALMIAVCAGPSRAEEVRAAVGKPLIAAKSAMAAHNYAKAMAFVRQADDVAGKTAYESLRWRMPPATSPPRRGHIRR